MQSWMRKKKRRLQRRREKMSFAPSRQVNVVQRISNVHDCSFKPPRITMSRIPTRKQFGEHVQPPAFGEVLAFAALLTNVVVEPSSEMVILDVTPDQTNDKPDQPEPKQTVQQEPQPNNLQDDMSFDSVEPENSIHHNVKVDPNSNTSSWWNWIWGTSSSDVVSDGTQ